MVSITRSDYKYLLTVFVIQIFVLLCCCNHRYYFVDAQFLGTGSSRLDHNAQEVVKEMAEEFAEIIEDKEHIQDEFDHMFSKDEIRHITDEQMAFTWFSGHDTDGDEMIDGLELYKAIHHAKVHKESHEHKLPEQAPPPGVPQLHFDPELEAFIEGTEDIGAIVFVDQLLSNYDIDEDGRLNFVEFFSSYEEAKETLKIS